ncbi:MULTISPECIES: hypothetical protein [unclassified Sinorhizobium]|uniref:hypothetical protein n=1 Tax=unclassified Sinorhizobium TaxID=2613772 RepID=UPI003526A2F5
MIRARLALSRLFVLIGWNLIVGKGEPVLDDMFEGLNDALKGRQNYEKWRDTLPEDFLRKD